MLIPFHRQGPWLGTCQGHASHQWQQFCADTQLFPVFISVPALLGDTPPACPPGSSHRCPVAWRPQLLETRAVEGPDRRAAPRPTNPSPIVPRRLTSEDVVAGTAGPLEASSRRPSKLGRWRQDPRRRTRRLLRLPSSAGARGGASPSSRDSGDPGGGGCDPCDVERSSPKAVWGRREGETNPPQPAQQNTASPPSRSGRMRRQQAHAGGGTCGTGTRPCPAPIAGEHSTNSIITAK